MPFTLAPGRGGGRNPLNEPAGCALVALPRLLLSLALLGLAARHLARRRGAAGS